MPVGLQESISRLASLDRSIGFRTTTYYDPSLTPAPQLALLRQSLSAGPVPTEALRAVACLAFSCLERSRAELSPAYRAREPVEQDLEWARGCCDLVAVEAICRQP